MNHIPQDVRRMETRKKLMEAAIALFSEKGYYMTNSKEIAKLAGVSVGSFYAYFEDKKVLLKEILNDYIEQIIPEVSEDEGVATADISEHEKLIRNMITMHEFTEGFFQQVTLLSNTDEEIRAIYNEYLDNVLRQIQAILLSKSKELTNTEVNAISIVLYSAMEGVIHMIKFKKVAVDEEALIHQLIHLFKFYIGK